MYDRNHDARVRAAAFQWLTEQVDKHGDVLKREVLTEGFIFNGNRVPLVSPQGIFKPRLLQEVPLSITTAPNSPYSDSFSPDGLLHYRYRGTDPNHPDNRGLRTAMERRIPLVYFHGVAPGRYVPAWPVFIVDDNPNQLSFTVAVDETKHLHFPAEADSLSIYTREDTTGVRRAYITSLTRVRLHQKAFRERVLEAYQRQCALCRLRHEELLDAAHIIPDKEPEGEPVVSNGLALCHLHHTAFDRHFIGIRPDFIVEVRPDILTESDGPTLKYAIQGLHGSRVFLPSKELHRPNPRLIQLRYDQFKESNRIA